jgi:hypothetical protein
MTSLNGSFAGIKGFSQDPGQRDIRVNKMSRHANRLVYSGSLFRKTGELMQKKGEKFSD